MSSSRAFSRACARASPTTESILLTYEELNPLSGRQLADMGISQLSIREIARASVSAS